MSRNYTLILALSFCTFSASYAQTVYINDGSSTNYTLNTGDSLYIRQGTFTGKITAQSKGAKITVAAGATFKPSSINTYHSIYRIYGTAFFPGGISTQDGFALENQGTATINGNFAANSRATIVNNNPGVMEIKGGATFNNTNDTLINYGDIVIQNNLNINGSSSLFTNRGNLLINGSFVLNNTNGQIRNEGYWYAKGGITSNVNITITNTCRLVSGKAITIHSGVIYNSGLLWASNEQNASAITNNNGTIINLDQGVIKAVKFTNGSTLKGNGFLYLTGQTTARGTIGQSGNTSDTLRVYTVNRSNVNQIFDVQQGTIYPNVIYFPFPAPDTLTSSSYPCYENSLKILPVEWENFSAKLSANTPVVQWSVQQSSGARFEVQRSFDGADFIAAAHFQNEQTTYEFADRAVNMNRSPVVYYRVKASLPNGNESYSEVKMLRLDQTAKPNPIAVSPNPFNSCLSVGYEAISGGTVAIKVFNLRGQLQYHHQIKVNKGSNRMMISESSNWKSGIYMIAIYTESGLSASSKVVKQ